MKTLDKNGEGCILTLRGTPQMGKYIRDDLKFLKPYYGAQRQAIHVALKNERSRILQGGEVPTADMTQRKQKRVKATAAEQNRRAERMRAAGVTPEDEPAQGSTGDLYAMMLHEAPVSVFDTWIRSVETAREAETAETAETAESNAQRISDLEFDRQRFEDIVEPLPEAVAARPEKGMLGNVTAAETGEDWSSYAPPVEAASPAAEEKEQW